jgi:hypothetical protein
MERLQALGQFTPPVLSQLEDALDRSLQFTNAVVTADLWDVERLAACEHCAPERIERMWRSNVTGRAEKRIACQACVGA